MKTIDGIDSITKEISRRNLFRYMGNAAIALPFMRTLLETQAFGEVNRKRAVFFFYPNGIAGGSFHPSTTGTDFKLKASTMALEAIRSDIIIPKNLNYNLTGTHEDGLQYCLTGVPGRKKAVSIDTVLGERLKANASLPVLRLGTSASTHQQSEMRYCSFFAEGKPSQIENNPTRTFNALFGASFENSGNSPKGMSLDVRKSVLDSDIDELKRLHVSLGTIEKVKLDLHVEAIREIERRLQNSGIPETEARNPQCTKTLRNRKVYAMDGNEWLRDDAVVNVLDLNIEIAVQAMACGVTNVVFIQNSNAGSYIRHNSDGIPGSGEDAHEHAHNNPSRHALNTNFYMGKFASLVSGMKDIKEGDNSLLYNSSVLALSEFADGRLHNMKGVGTILAGQAAGYFKTGRCIDAKGDSHNKLLVSVMQSLGFNDQTFGDPTLGTGPLPGLTG